MTKEDLIKARAKYLHYQWSDYDWDLLNTKSKEYFTKLATSDVEWFASQGLGFPKDNQITFSPCSACGKIKCEPCDELKKYAIRTDMHHAGIQEFQSLQGI